MYPTTATWSNGTQPQRSDRVNRIAVSENSALQPASGPRVTAPQPRPVQPEESEVATDPVTTALETRPGWRPEQFPGTSGRCRESTNERLGARAPVPCKTSNPFLAGTPYLDGLALQDAFLTPKSSHGAGAFERT